MKLKISLILLLVLSLFPLQAVTYKSCNWINHAISVSEFQLLAAAEKFKCTKKSPRTFEHNQVELVGTNDWTSGFFPGSLWYLYELTKNDSCKKEAIRYTEFLEKAQYRTDTHDLGFIVYCSYGNGFRLTGDPDYKAVLETASQSLMTRYHPTVGLVKSWDKRKWEYPVIIDNMLNLELLCEGSKLSGNPNPLQAAISHADKTIINHFRPDNSCYHVVDYDSITGNVKNRGTHQGFCDSSSWARGQGWALYGYTMMYRETKKLIYLEQAQKVAEFILHHPNLPKDKIPYWDFSAPNMPNAPRDASAAAIYASALIELSGYVTEKNDYLQIAGEILKTLSSEEYLAKVGENGFFILKHSTGNWPSKSEIDAPLSYADYYYLEAMVRYIKKKNIKL
ncbi:MAG: glycoside hydrolase family 88 protein [Bacteroidales bacterium]|nr:glycoside hydrolase family 88 protein [Bacteroidales bacterium]